MRLKIIKANVIKYLVPPPHLNDTVSVLSRRERYPKREKLICKNEMVYTRESSGLPSMGNE